MSINLEQIAERFHKIFEGSRTAHGVCAYSERRNEKGKLEKEKAKTVHEPVALADWVRHLAGRKPGIGIIPVREDGTCVFGAVDIDVYKEFDHGALVRRLAQSLTPVIVCRSSSGGAHIYLFGSEPIPSGLMMRRLVEVAAIVGHNVVLIKDADGRLNYDPKKSNAEIFPKQEKPDVGNWINAPYFGNARHAVQIDGSDMPVVDFLDFAEPLKHPLSWFEQPLPVPKTSDQTELDMLAGFAGRNCALTSIAGKLVAAGLSVDAVFAALMVENARFNPPLEESNIRATIMHSVAKWRARADQKAAASKVEIVSAEVLENMEIPPLRWVVHNLIPTAGVTVLAARPKDGKSFLALQAAVAVAGGRNLLDKFHTEQGRVLYFGLEDNDARLQRRQRQAGADLTALKQLDFSKNLKLNADGIEELVRLAPNYSLIVIDTFVNAVAGMERKKDANPFRADYYEIEVLKQIARDHSTAFLLVHHTRKKVKDDSDLNALDQVMGTTGLTAAADSILLLSKINQSADSWQVKLFVRGKDTNLSEPLVMTCAPGDGCWRLDGPADTVMASQARREIMQLLHKHERMKPAEIAAELNKNQSTIRNTLRAMETAGLVDSNKGDYWPASRPQDNLPFQ